MSQSNNDSTVFANESYITINSNIIFGFGAKLQTTITYILL